MTLPRLTRILGLFNPGAAAGAAAGAAPTSAGRTPPPVSRWRAATASIMMSRNVAYCPAGAVLWSTGPGTGGDANGAGVHRNNNVAALRNAHGENMGAYHVVAPFVATAATRDAHPHQA